jgi:hypothetical protein
VIINVDVRDITELPPAACLITSPPYNVGIKYGSAVDDAMPWGEYRELADATCQLASKSLVTGGPAWVNTAPIVPLDQESSDSRTRNQPVTSVGGRSGRGRTRRMGLRLLADIG